MPFWTPARGAAALADEFGKETAIQLLADILDEKKMPDALFLRVMSHVSGREQRTMSGPYSAPGWHEWAHTWAARAIGYLGGSEAEDALLRAAQHPHWRVRRTVIRSLGWCGGAKSLPAVAAASHDDDQRVRSQAPVSENKVRARLDL